MSKYITLGYGDVNGKGPSLVLAGTNVELTDQVRLVTGIKASGNYPKDVVRVELAEVVIRTVGICTKTASAVAAKDAKQQQLRIAELHRKDPVRKKASEKDELKKAIGDAAVARNKLIPIRQAAQVAANDARYNWELNQSKDNRKALDEAEAAQQKAAEDIAKAQAKVDDLQARLTALLAPKPEKK